MPPRARSRSRPSPGPSPLSEGDVALLRERLEAGKKPRVVLLVDTAVGAKGTSVQVISFTEPAVGEFISVRLHDDVVPFSPTELSLPVRGRRTPETAGKQPAATNSPAESSSPPGPSRTPVLPLSAPTETRRPARLVAVPEPEDKPEDRPEDGPEGRPEDKAQESSAPKSTAAPNTAAENPTSQRRAPRRSARSGGFSVTMRFSGRSWSYESTRGGRRSSARPLNLAAVRAFADRLDDPALRRDLQGAIEVCRQQAQTRAEALRAELEHVEVELAELDE
jgi:hypothetical protein